MDATVLKLQKLYENRHSNEDEFNKFQDFVEGLDVEQIESLVGERISRNDGPQIISCILQGLSLKSQSQKKRVKLFEFVMAEIQNKEIPARNVSSIMTWLVMEVDKLSSTHLIRIADLCVNYIGNSHSAAQSCWKELLPKALTLIISKKEVDHYGSELSAEEYKKQVVVALCQANWDNAILTPLASMFIYIPLTTEEHQQVVNKLCSRLDDLQPDEVPPFTHQVLLLTKPYHSMTLFFALKKYYNRHIYRHDDSAAMLDSTKLESVDTIELISKKEVVENESTVLFHIEDCAKRSLGCTTELVKCAKSCVNAPELFLDPFLLAVLLTVSTVPCYQLQVLDIIKNMIMRVVQEEEKQHTSDWLRKILGTHCDVEQILIKLIKSRAWDQLSVLKGLVELSMTLLRSSPPVGSTGGKDSVAQRVWYFGRMIAVNVVKKHNHVAKYLLSTITDSIMSQPDVTQYTDCLCEMCETTPLLVLENPSVINRLLEALPTLPEKSSHKVTAALVSLVRMSNRVSDNIILVLRKSLFMREVGTRKMAVVGFLQLLKRMKIRGMQSFSQNSMELFSCPSIFSQQHCLTVHSQDNRSIGANNEGICLEVIGVLKRCFMQQLPVKICLYNGLNQTLKKNPELCGPVGSVVIGRLREFYETDTDILPPLNFSKAVITRQNEVVVVETLGHLVFVVNQVAITMKNASEASDDADVARDLEVLEAMMGSMVERFSKCDLKDFDLEGDLEATLEGRHKEEVMRQSLSVYQALIGYLLMTWDLSSTEEHPQQLLSLFRVHSLIADFGKKHVKKDKDAPKKKAGARDQSIILGKKAQPFTPPECVLDFETLKRFLNLLLGDSSEWSKDEVAGELRTKRVLHRYALQCCLDLLARTKSDLAEYKSKIIFLDLTSLAELLFKRCLLRFDECMDFEPAGAVTAVECFTEICSLVMLHFRTKLPKFLEDVCDTATSAGLSSQLEVVIKFYLKSLTKILESGDLDGDDGGDLPDDHYNRHLVTVLLAGLNILSLQLPVSQPAIGKVLQWLTSTSQKMKLPSVNNVKMFLSLMFSLLARCKSETSIHDNLALQLCNLFRTINDIEVENCPVKLEMVNHSNKTAVLGLLCSMLHGRLDAVDWVILRLRAELPHIAHPDACTSSPKSRKAVLKRKEKDMVQELGLIVSSVQWVASIAIPEGPPAELVSRLLIHAYSTLTAFTKYFSLRSSPHNPVYQEARFAKLVKLSASHLSSQVGEFLLYIESVDQGNDENARKSNAKLLRQAKKQTVYIPKLVAELENFTKCVTQLSVKCKDPSLVMNVKLTTTRDFRLNTKRLEEVLKRNHESDSDGSENETSVATNGGESSRTKSSSQQSSRSSTQQSVKSSSQRTANTSQRNSASQKNSPKPSTSQPKKRRKKS